MWPYYDKNLLVQWQNTLTLLYIFARNSYAIIFLIILPNTSQIFNLHFILYIQNIIYKIFGDNGVFRFLLLLINHILYFDVNKTTDPFPSSVTYYRYRKFAKSESSDVAVLFIMLLVHLRALTILWHKTNV